MTTNPYNITLNSGESQLITFWVNASGVIDNTYEFFVYANMTSQLYVNNKTSVWNTTIIDDTYPIWNGNSTNLTDITEIGSLIHFHIPPINNNPDKYIFSWYNSTEWVNDTAASYISGTNIDVTKTLPTDNGMINWTFYFNDTSGNTVQTDVWSIDIYSVYKVGLELIYPTSDIDVTQYEWFNVTVNVSCPFLDCGEINVTLDPTPNTIYNFTNCGKTGRDGPSQSECNSTYSGTTLDGDVYTRADHPFSSLQISTVNP
jgi:hypothetical protein